MSYRNFFSLGICVYMSLFFIPAWNWTHIPISLPPQTATVTRTPTQTEKVTPSPSSNPTSTTTNTASPTPSPTLTLTPTATLFAPTFTATASAIATAIATLSPSPTTLPPPTLTAPPSSCPCPVYLPLVFSISLTVIQETEPNNTFPQAQTLLTLPVSVNGIHDGEADTGDVYQFELTAGQIVHVTLTTGNPTGVQLLAYSGEAPTEIVRDFEVPFDLNFLAIATGTYYVYVYTPGSTNNTAAYALSVALMEANP